MMTLEQAKIAMRARIVAFTGLLPAQLQWPNRPFTTPATGIWGRVNFVGGDAFIAGLADKPCTRETGMLIIQLFERKNQGTANLNTLADSLAEWLAYYTTAGLELLAASKIEAGDGSTVGTPEGTGFFQINVSVPYRVN